MLGMMQDWPLVVPSILDHAARFHGEREVVSRSVEGPMVRSTYGEIHSRARKVAKALTKRGVRLGDRLGTLAWNTGRHLEAWYGIMGIGAVCHTINPRLFPEQIAYIVNHAEDRMIFVDLTFVPILEKLGKQIDVVETFVILTDRAHMPQTTLHGRQHIGLRGCQVGRHAHACCSHVSCQCLGDHLRLPDGRHEDGNAGSKTRRAIRL